jgi:hypothetical protein
MHLVQLLLPLTDNAGHPFPETVLRGIQKELCERFGGVTAYSRAPAEGIWQEGGTKMKDDIIVVEVMTGRLDRGWWNAFRRRLEKSLGQAELVVRTQCVERL